VAEEPQRTTQPVLAEATTPAAVAVAVVVVALAAKASSLFDTRSEETLWLTLQN
jgi:hypothetical protein